jgi:hypothetical protein
MVVISYLLSLGRSWIDIEDYVNSDDPSSYQWDVPEWECFPSECIWIVPGTINLED